MRPLTVAMTITSATYTTVFLAPMTLRNTNMLGNDSAGPANNNANAGPFPIPAPSNPCKIGTSVNVAKYMNAPTTDAKKFASSEFPPTARANHADGTNPS